MHKSIIVIAALLGAAILTFAGCGNMIHDLHDKEGGGGSRPGPVPEPVPGPEGPAPLNGQVTLHWNYYQGLDGPDEQVAVSLGLPDTPLDASAYQTPWFTPVIWHKNRNFDRPLEPGYDPDNVYQAGEVLGETDTELWAEWYITEQPAGSVTGWLAQAPAGPDPAQHPVRVPVRWTIARGNWERLLTEIHGGAREVELDMRNCVGSVGDDIFNSVTGVFDADGAMVGDAQTGKGWVVALALPDTVRETRDYTFPAVNFAGFTGLRGVSGEGMERIGDTAFRQIPLTGASFPNVTAIGEDAFTRCTNLKKADFPLAEDISIDAFAGCINLEEVRFPLLESIGARSFSGCYALKEAEFPGITTGDIGTTAFDSSGLESVSFPNARGAIGEGAFSECEYLETVHIPQITVIYGSAFCDCASLTSITMGETPPVLNGFIHFTSTTPDNFTIRVPIGSVTAYENWINSNSARFNTSGTNIVIEGY
jgi:hypothetical protein